MTMDPQATRHVLQVPFKGARNYLHSTDIFDALWRHSVNPSLITFKRLIHSPQIIVQSEALPGVQVAAVVDTGGADLKHRLYVYADEKASSRTTRPDRSDQVVADVAVIDVNARAASLVIEREHDFSTVEAAVSLTKALHHSVLPNVEKWLVGSMKYHKPSYAERQAMTMRARIKQVMGAGRLTETEIFADGNHLFTIYFTPRS